MAVKKRIDLLMVERGLVESRALAQRLIMAGSVRCKGMVVLKPSAPIDPAANIEIDWGPAYVSRGGYKLAAAFETFNVDVKGKICADVGASTGGFTDCLLQNDAERVYAIDVGKGILHWKLRQDPRVVVMEDVNARYVKSLPELINLATVDVSFISLKTLLPVIQGWFYQGKSPINNAFGGEVIALIKPQFEAGKKVAKRGDGVIRDAAIHRFVLEDILSFCVRQNFSVEGLIRSPLLGPKGNVEFLVWLTLGYLNRGRQAAFNQTEAISELLGDLPLE